MLSAVVFINPNKLLQPRKHTEDAEMKQRRKAPAHHLVGEEYCCVQRMILTVLFRVRTWQMRFLGSMSTCR